MKSDLRIKKDIFFGKFSLEYNFSLEDSALNEKRVDLAKIFISSLLPIECIKERSIIDAKGRDALNLIDNKIASDLLPNGDEFIFIKGSWSESSSEDEELHATNEKIEPISNDFTFRINSVFEEYIGRNQISYKCVSISEGDLPRAILGEAENEDKIIRCSALRVGIDLFFPHFFNLLGFGPSANQTLLIESYESSFKVRITSENMLKSSQLPLERNNLFTNLDKIIEQIFSLSLLEDYKEKLNTK